MENLNESIAFSRSPPITISSIAGPNFPTQQHFGTMRTPLTQSHEAINHSLRIAPPPPPPPVIGKSLTSFTCLLL